MHLPADERALHAEATKLEAKAADCRIRAAELRQKRLAATLLFDRLVFAAVSRCPCGWGLAYDPVAPQGTNGPFRGILGGHWDCAGILLGLADQAKKHEAKLPFAFYEIKAEGQASAYGATTRPTADEYAKLTAPTAGG